MAVESAQGEEQMEQKIIPLTLEQCEQVSGGSGYITSTGKSGYISSTGKEDTDTSTSDTSSTTSRGGYISSTG
jgi:hypothetical protein